MLSGNGRHRRPRQAPALVVAAGVTGSAIAIPLLGATGAHAADGANWDRVAECETGGAWSQNSGNGYYGGLQLSQDVWERYGGTEYAPSADQASRSQQIRVAERLHADQGIAAWPTCALLAGMGNGPAPTDGGTGSTGDGTSEQPTAPETSDTPEPSGTTESPEPTSETSSSSPSPSSPPTSDATSDSGDDSTKSDTSPEAESTDSADSQGVDASPTASPETGETDKAGQSGGDSALTDTGDSGAGKHRGDSADEGAADGRASESSGRHASRGEDEAREVSDGSYTVRSGDSLWGIADSLELDGGWRSLYVGNKQVVGTDPDHILPGQTLTVTGESGEK
ncbi:transglycosylase family protein [Streptomyces thinghirensis]|uniref:Resuscitation-promoting factor protein RpfC n=1 Tax=Streptomyces thinghirensis TaxID=551547 RepID=A0ABP9T8W8_9ACTN